MLFAVAYAVVYGWHVLWYMLWNAPVSKDDFVEYNTVSNEFPIGNWCFM
jgi:hypothetical protein